MAMPMFQSWFDVADDHCDVLLHVRVNGPDQSGQPAEPGGLMAASPKLAGTDSRKRQRMGNEAEAVQQASAMTVTAQPSCSSADTAKATAHKTYSLHAVILSAASSYFKARLSRAWQSQASGAAPGSGRPATIRHELEEHVHADEVEAMQLLLRLMYGHPVPEESSMQLRFQCLRLADRLEAVQCMDALLAGLTCMAKAATTSEVAKQAFAMPPGAASRPAATQLFSLCTGVLKRLFSCVPVVIGNKQLRQDFCTLPPQAVLAWIGIGDLEVQSENCVVYLLTAWVTAQGAAGVSTEQLEQLAHQVRVLHLGPAYQYHVLPNLEWFKGCNSMQHLPTLLAHKGAGKSTPAPYYGGAPTEAPQVFPKLALQNSLPWHGAGEWVAGPRRQYGGRATCNLAWRVDAAQLQVLYSGQVVCSNVFRVINGIPIGLCIKPVTDTAAQPGKTAGLFCYVKPERTVGLPWTDAALAIIQLFSCKVTAAVGRNSCQAQLSNGTLWGTRGCGWEALFKRTEPGDAATFEQLMAPYLNNGQLHVEATFGLMDAA